MTDGSVFLGESMGVRRSYSALQTDATYVLNGLLKRSGHSQEDTLFEAIKVCDEEGVINRNDKNPWVIDYLKILNRRANWGKHKWRKVSLSKMAKEWHSFRRIVVHYAVRAGIDPDRVTSGDC